ncbi:hypothetical protein AB4072_12470 [Microvirga sp. 2MCAF38]|uniref:hypothetical protein n=1 Tax=Microvirga sp. 2MCAF38 TaxID=3232989 RepID=UPI003F9A8F47
MQEAGHHRRFQNGIDHIDLSKTDANTAGCRHDKFKVLLDGNAAFAKAGQLRYDVKTGFFSCNTEGVGGGGIHHLFEEQAGSSELE